MTDDWRAEYQARKTEEHLQARRDLRKACELLKQLGVQTLVLSYDGEDGAGSVYEVTFQPLPEAGIPEAMAETIQAGGYWLLPPGWELDAGAYGTLTIDLQTQRVRREHHRRVLLIESQTDELEL